MYTELSRLEDLPVGYVHTLQALNLIPLWPSMRVALPREAPIRRAEPYLWSYREIRPQLIRAGNLAPIEKAERRVLVLCNPGYGPEALRATATIYVGFQLILPGETAPNHRHTASAIRFVIEGGGGYTVVAGERLPMEKGDLILTPSWLWHEHGHDGTDPVIWLDALDLPLLIDLEASYSVESPSQKITDPSNTSNVRFRQGGIIPYNSLTRQRAKYPLMRFPWSNVRGTLDAFAKAMGPRELAHLAYVNPETGLECLPTLGFSALRLQSHEPVQFPRHSASMVLHAVEGEGRVHVDHKEFAFSEGDTVAVPTHAEVHMEATGVKPAYLFIVDDAPLQRRLGIYQTLDEEGRSE